MRWTDEKRDEFRKAWLAGLTRQQLCERFGTSVGHVSRLRRELALPLRAPGKPRRMLPPAWTDARVRRLKELWPDLSIRVEDIARELEVSLSGLDDFRRKHGANLGLHPRPHGGGRARQREERTKPRPEPRPERRPAVLESSIPWPSKERLMAGR